MEAILTEDEVKAILTSATNVKTNQLGLNLVLTRSKGLLRTSPSAETLTKCTNEINAYLSKYSNVMKKEIEMLKNITL